MSFSVELCLAFIHKVKKYAYIYKKCVINYAAGKNMLEYNKANFWAPISEPQPQ